MEALDDNKIVASVLIDLSKAFDTIDLLQKLHAYGVQGSELNWFSNYLSGCKQRVVIDGVASEWTLVKVGVPQGSILGPLLFVLFINHLADVVEFSKTNLYADDTAIYLDDNDPAVLGSRIKHNLNKVGGWIRENGLKMNASKTQLMVLTRKSKSRIASSVELCLESTPLQKRDSVRYLGVEVDNELSWKPHIHNLHHQCMGKLAQIRKSCFHLPVKPATYFT